MHYVKEIQSPEGLGALVDAMAAQVARPSHADRNKGLFGLLFIAEAHPEMVSYIHERAGRWLRRIARQSVRENVGPPAEMILALAGADRAR